MRTKGTKYEKINKPHKKMVPVSAFAMQEGIAVGQVYMKHDRHFIGYKDKTGKLTGTKANYPGYIIRQFQGMNYVIPD
jgi:hypothetical protein